MSQKFRAWLVEDGIDGLDLAMERMTFDARSAAERQAEYDHAYRDGYEWSWPVAYYVADQTGAIVTVEVERHIVPEFYAGKPKAVETTVGGT
jgi:hypothetical protein